MVTTTSVNSGLWWSSCCCYHVDRQLLNEVSLWTKTCVEFRWFTSHCKAVSKGPLYITNLGGLENVTIGKNFYKLHMEQEVDTLYIWKQSHQGKSQEVSQKKIVEIKVKKHRMQENVKALHKAAIESAKKQKVCISQLTLLTQSNWKTTRIKQKALADLDEQLKESYVI